MPRFDVGAQQGKCFRCIGRRAAGWRRGAWRICTGKPARVLGYHVGDAHAQVGARQDRRHLHPILVLL